MDRACIERAQQGDRDAYERIAAEVADGLFRLAHRIVRDVDRAEDAVQQTLVTIWTDLPGLRDPDRFDAWTYRLTVRFCLAEARRNRRIGVTFVGLTDHARSTPDPTDDVVTRDEIERAFDSLTPDHRAVLVLRYQLGLSLPEVASAMGIRYGTVGSRLHRATALLRAALDADARMTAAQEVVA